VSAFSFLEVVVNGFSGPLLILVVSAFRRDMRARRLDLTTVIGYIVYVVIGINLAHWLSPQLAHSYDAAYMRADAAIGFHPIVFADTIAAHRIVMKVLILAYIALPVVIALAWVIEQSLQMRRAVLFGGCLCFCFYGLFPAVGPGHFDWVRQLPLPDAPNNCMPSMHFTWSLLLALNARSPRLRCALWGYVALIASATLGLREHYLVDLIAAVPYTLAIQWMAARATNPSVLESVRSAARRRAHWDAEGLTPSVTE
jgi:hypothetical protein